MLLNRFDEMTSVEVLPDHELLVVYGTDDFVIAMPDCELLAFKPDEVTFREFMIPERFDRFHEMLSNTDLV